MTRYRRFRQKYRAMRQQLRQQQLLIDRLTSLAALPITNDIVINGGSTVVTTTIAQVIPITNELHTSITPPPDHHNPWIKACEDGNSGHDRDLYRFHD